MLLFPAHPKTKTTLLNLLAGDVNACERLITNIKIKNPQMNEQACYTKAIEDLIRDRR